MDSIIRTKIDQKHNTLLIQPFNANYFNDYRAYVLGISSDQLQRLEIFRAADQYLYSLEDFQSVSGVDDSLLLLVKPYLKFPQEKNYFESETKNLEFKNINRATAEDLKKMLTGQELALVQATKFDEVKKDLNCGMGFFNPHRMINQHSLGHSQSWRFKKQKKYNYYD